MQIVTSILLQPTNKNSVYSVTKETKTMLNMLDVLRKKRRKNQGKLIKFYIFTVQHKTSFES